MRMQASGAAELAVPAKSESRRRGGDNAAFDALLMTAQSAQVTALTVTFTDATGLKARDEEEASARHTRVTQETAEARQAEVEAHAAQRGGSSAMESNRAGARQERAAAGKEATPAPTFPGADAKNTAATQGPAESLVFPQPAIDQEAAFLTSAREGQSNLSKEPPQEIPVKAEPPSTPPERPASVTAVATTDAAAAKPMVDADQAGAASAARTVGRLLAGGGALESVKAPVEASDASARHVSTPARPEQAAKEPASREPQNAEKKQAESTDDSRRAAFAKLVQQVRLNQGVRVSSATIRLDPPELGKMRIDVRMVDGAMRIRVDAASPHARALLASRASELVAALREQNVTVEKLEIVGPGADGQDSSVFFENDADPGSRAEDGRWMEDPTGESRRGEAEGGTDEGVGATGEIAAPPTYAAQDGRLDVRI